MSSLYAKTHPNEDEIIIISHVEFSFHRVQRIDAKRFLDAAAHNVRHVLALQFSSDNISRMQRANSTHAKMCLGGASRHVFVGPGHPAIVRSLGLQKVRLAFDC